MPRKALDLLTESMFYVLMVLCRASLCGTDIAAQVEAITRGRVRLGPATLYTILGKFERAGYTREVETCGRRRTYQVTEQGRAAYLQEVERLRQGLRDAQREEARHD